MLTKRSAEPFYHGMSSLGGLLASDVFVGALQRTREQWGKGPRSLRARVLGSEYMITDCQRGLLAGSEVWPSGGTRSQVLINHITENASTPRIARWLLFWSDAFHVVGIFDFDMRAGSMCIHEDSFRQLALNALRSDPSVGNPPDLSVLPPHFSDGGVS